MELKGIAASDGIAIAKAYKLEEQPIKIKNNLITNFDHELQKLETALKQSLDEIKRLYEVTQEKLGEEKAQIFAAHEQMISDPAFLDEIKILIKKEKFNVAWATRQAADKFIAQFKAMDNDYFRERASDVEDIATRLLKNLLGIRIQDLAIINEEVIIIAHDLTPSQTVQLNPKFVKGFLCEIGGRTSHAAIMARSLEIPAVLGLKDLLLQVKNNDLIVMDGNKGVVILNLEPSQLNHWKQEQENHLKNQKALEKYRYEKAVSLDGIKVGIEGNIGSIKDIQSVIDNGGAGVGLFRTEFLYMDSNHWPTEEEQYQAYKSVLEAMKDDMVVIRTLDIGGDKKLNYFKFPHEDNPFLGYRAIRLNLDRIDIFKTQLRALLKASVHGKLAIMFPMITTVDEFIQAKKITLECQAELEKENIKVSENFQIGMMVEVPSAAVLSDVFCQYADFVSIGTNDLIQYSNAVDRMSEKVAYLYQPYHPAILRLIKMTIDGAKLNNKWSGMCGELAGEPLAAPLLLGMGLNYFSMSASSILKVKQLINNLNQKECAELVSEVLQYKNEADVKVRVQEFLATKKLI